MTVGATVQGFPSCCGATIVHGFSDAYADSTKYWSSYKFLEGHVYIAILAAGQQLRYSKMLEEALFHCVSDKTVNKNSANRLYVWIRDPGKSPEPEIKKSFFDKVTFS